VAGAGAKAAAALAKFGLVKPPPPPPPDSPSTMALTPEQKSALNQAGSHVMACHATPSNGM